MINLRRNGQRRIATRAAALTAAALLAGCANIEAGGSAASGGASGPRAATTASETDLAFAMRVFDEACLAGAPSFSSTQAVLTAEGFGPADAAGLRRHGGRAVSAELNSGARAFCAVTLRKGDRAGFTAAIAQTLRARYGAVDQRNTPRAVIWRKLGGSPDLLVTQFFPEPSDGDMSVQVVRRQRR